MRTKSEVAKELLKIMGEENPTFDCALPQSWFDEFLKLTGTNPSGHIVWYYPKGHILGMPFAVTVEGLKKLNEYTYRRA